MPRRAAPVVFGGLHCPKLHVAPAVLNTPVAGAFGVSLPAKVRGIKKNSGVCECTRPDCCPSPDGRRGVNLRCHRSCKCLKSHKKIVWKQKCRNVKLLNCCPKAWVDVQVNACRGLRCAEICSRCLVPSYAKQGKLHGCSGLCTVISFPIVHCKSSSLQRSCARCSYSHPA